MLGIDNRRLDQAVYHPQLISYSGIDPEKWPELIPKDAIVGTVLPEVAQELGLSSKTKIVAAVNDTQAGGMATSAFKGTHGAISIGTTGVMLTHVNFKRTDLKDLIGSAPSPVPDTYFVVAENGLAGKVVEFFLEKLIYPRDSFADHSTDEKFAALDRVLASVPPGSNGLLFLPWLSGSTAPVEDIHMRGGILNMSLDTTREAMAKAAVEGVIFNLNWLRQAVEKFAGRSFSHLLFYGGGAQSAEITQIMADIFQLPIHRVAQPDYTVARGAAFLAFQRLGILSYDDFEARLSIQAVVEPRQELADMYAGRFKQFLAAFKKTRTLFKSSYTAKSQPDHRNEKDNR
jgi:xylulokinase